MTPLELTGRDVAGLLAGFRRGAFTPSEVVAAVYDQVAAVDPAINAHWHLTAETAVAEAAVADARWRSGAPRALEGVPVGVKDVIDVADHPATGGSSIYLHRRADTDATVVARLRAAGAIVVTKDATTEFGVGGPLNPTFGPTRNPWAPEHWTGGSSCGAAAGLAAGTVPAAIGTDAGGSVRIPAAWCGVVGLKPTMGRVSRHGVMPCSWHGEVVGPMARTVSDAGALLAVVAGADPADRRTAPVPPPEVPPEDDLSSLRVGVAPDWWGEIADEATSAVTAQAVEMLRDAGVRIVTVEGLPPLRELHDLSYAIVWAEAAWWHDNHTDYRHLMDPVGVDRLAAGRDVRAGEYFRLLQRRAEAQRQVLAALEPVDTLLTPTTVTTAPRLDDLTVAVGENAVPLHQGYALLTAHANLTGFPALAVPAGTAANGLPLSVQFTARPWDEAACCRAGRAYERLANHPATFPDLSTAPRRSRPPGLDPGAPRPVSTPYLAGGPDPGLELTTWVDSGGPAAGEPGTGRA